MPCTSGVDPPRASADPRNYVPIVSSERALDALRENLRAGCPRIALQGPSGIGKTLLLRVLAARELRHAREVIFSPFLHLPAEDVARWLLHLLERPAGGTGAQDDQFLSEINARGTHATLLLVDEFQSTPPATARRLADLAAAARGGLVLVTAERPGRGMDALRTVFQPEATVSLPGPLPPHEMEALCDAMLLQSGVELARRRDGAEERDRVVARARGIPGLLTPEILRCGKDDFVGSAAVAARCAEPLCPTVEEGPGGLGIEDAPLESPAPTNEATLEPRLQQGAPVASALQARTARRAQSTIVRARAARTGSRNTAAALAASALRGARALATIAAMTRSAAVRFASRLGDALRGALAGLRPALEQRLQQCARVASALRARAARRAQSTIARVRRTVRTLSGNTAAVLAASVLYASSLREGLASRWRERRTRSAISTRFAGSAVATAVLLALIAWGWSEGIDHATARDAVPVHAERAVVRVQVNARPWAIIRVDDVEVGPTPLSHLHLSPGPHEFEANFADGRSVRRRIEISSEQRTVSLR